MKCLFILPLDYSCNQQDYGPTRHHEPPAARALERDFHREKCVDLGNFTKVQLVVSALFLKVKDSRFKTFISADYRHGRATSSTNRAV